MIPSNLRGPARLAAHLENIVMRPGFYPYPQEAMKRGVAFGRRKPALEGMGPVITPTNLTDPKRRFGADIGRKLLCFKREIDKSPLEIVGKTRPAFIEFEDWRPGIQARMTSHGDVPISRLVKTAGRRSGIPPEDLRELGLDMAFVAELARERPKDTELNGFVAGMLLFASGDGDSQRMAVEAFRRSAVVYLVKMHGSRHAALGDLAFFSAMKAGLPADEVNRLGSLAAKLWYTALYRGRDYSPFAAMCIDRGLRIAFGVGAWHHVMKFFHRMAHDGESGVAYEMRDRLQIGIDYVRAAWAAANHVAHEGGRYTWQRHMDPLVRAVWNWKQLPACERPPEFFTVQGLLPFAGRLRREYAKDYGF